MFAFGSLKKLFLMGQSKDKKRLVVSVMKLRGRQGHFFVVS
jgi:hypothetical protein